MDDWRGHVDDLLYAGEEVLARIGRGPEEVVVTSHRVLALTPAADGANFRAIDRPNVTDVRFESTGRSGLAVQGLKVLVVGAFLLAGGLFVDLGGIFGTGTPSSAGSVGAGGILQILSLARTAASLANEALLALGAVATLAGLAGIAGYLLTRSHDLVLGVAGGADLRLDADAFGQSDREAIETALGRP